MKQRGFWFKRLFVVLVLLTFVPVVVDAGLMGIKGSVDYLYGRFPLLLDFEPFGFSSWRHSPLPYAAVMVRNRWSGTSYSTAAPNSLGLHFDTIDPESKPKSDLLNAVYSANRFQEIKLDPSAVMQFPYFRIVPDPERIWLIGKAGEVLEFVGDKFEIHSTEYNRTLARDLAQRPSSFNEAFSMDGLPTVMIINDKGQREVLQFRDKQWQSLGQIILLDAQKSWVDAAGNEILSSTAISPNPNPPGGAGGLGIGLTGGDTLRIVTIGSTQHLFWQTSDQLLYRRGIDLRPLNDQPHDGLGDSKSPATSSGNSTSAAAPSVTNDWTVVKNKLLPWTQWFPVAAGGEPCVILVDSSFNPPTATAFHKLDGRWEQFAKTKLLFASLNFFTGSLDDGSKAYLACMTQRGRVRVVSLEADGFHPTSFDSLGESYNRMSLTEQWIAAGPWNLNGPWNVLILVISLLIWFQVSAILLSMGTSVLMCRDETRYEYGTKSANFGSLFSRAIAKTVDVTLLAAVVIALLQQQFQAKNIDWEIAFDAVRHFVFYEENLANVIQTGWICFFAGVAAWFVMAAMQGRWGFTPGKLVCGLRVTGTTLLPCGSARSLYRELLLLLDNLCFLSWVPGIARIAFSTKRQRFGDQAADTIVIRSRGRV